MSESTVLDCVGNTSLIALRKIPSHGASILLKVESENPTGNMKDRVGVAMIEAAERDGRLRADGSVVEYTGGSTGVSLAWVCAAKGYPLHIVTSDAFSKEKRIHMKMLGATVHLVPSEQGRITEKLTRDMIEMARGIASRPGSYWTDQLNNTDQLAAYHAMGDEIWRQTGGRVDAFVQSVGTGASFRGTLERLRQHHPALHAVAVEPSESAVLSGGTSGAHRIEGIGAGFVVPLWQPAAADRIERVSTGEANNMAARLAMEEGIFAGTSTGANVVAALRAAERLGAGVTVVTVMVDTGMKYLSQLAG